MSGLDALQAAITEKITPQDCNDACETLVHGELFEETENILRQVGTGADAQEAIKRIKNVERVIGGIARQCAITQDAVAERLRGIENLYVLLKRTVRQELGIAKTEDLERYRAISNITSACAILHARCLTVIEALRPQLNGRHLVRAERLTDEGSDADLGVAPANTAAELDFDIGPAKQADEDFDFTLDLTETPRAKPKA